MQKLIYLLLPLIKFMALVHSRSNYRETSQR